MSSVDNAHILDGLIEKSQLEPTVTMVTKWQSPKVMVSFWKLVYDAGETNEF